MTIRLGVTLPGVPFFNTNLAIWAAKVGQGPDIVGWYSDFSSAYAAGPVPASTYLAPIQNTGAINMIALQAIDANLQPDGITDTTTKLSTIISGSWDTYLTTWAHGMAAWGLPIMVRFLPEMNGNYNPWSEGVNGNTSGQFVAAWRHAWNLMAPICPNVQWIWNPNISYFGSTPLAELYPGDAYVDYAGIDGYNFGTYRSSGWVAPAALYGPTITQIQAITPKQIIFCELGCSDDSSGSKAGWITEFFQWVKTQPVEGFCWFDFDQRPGSPDWRVESSVPAQTAFNIGVQGLNPPPF